MIFCSDLQHQATVRVICQAGYSVLHEATAPPLLNWWEDKLLPKNKRHITSTLFHTYTDISKSMVES